MDTFQNFAKTTVTTGYDSAAVAIALTAGGGLRMPPAPFNAVWWNSTAYPDPADDPNVEVVRVTSVTTDALTITRAQEGTIATAKNTNGATYKLIAALTALTVNNLGTFAFSQSMPAATWVIAHNLNRYPTVIITDSSGTQVEGQVDYDSANQVTVKFNGAFSGDAYLN